MSGIDRADQMILYNSSLRKNRGWYKRIGLHIMEMFLHNAFQLFLESKRYENNKMSFLQFRRQIITSLIGDLHVIPELRPQAKFHYLETLPATKKKAPAKPCQWKRCRKEKRRETRCVCFLSD